MKKIDIEKLEKKETYQLPEHFFQDFEEKLNQKIQFSKTRKIPFWSYSVAASLVLLISIFFFMDREMFSATPPKSLVENQLKEISKSEEIKIKDENILLSNFEKKEDKIENNEIEKVSTYQTFSKEKKSPQKQISPSFVDLEVVDLEEEMLDNDVYLEIYD